MSLKKITAKFFTIYLMFFLSTPSAYAAGYYLENLTIKRIRTVGEYSNFSNTVELWFNETLTYPSGAQCTSTFRVHIDAKHKHVISAAYLAMMSGKKVSVYANESLPIRGGSCEISYLDVVNN
ncbi:hypothetical protein [Acinetobacter dispersus]|uniref:hypothetical protein n=1 Tax=Acinetobacter dispersus TaxID=70348 RepID=UPI00132ECF50|nr:hypothetical protein [Acinetobacter dispersus]QHH96418.1 hypothetical protein FPL17_02260 [Acinetobacter dispersus]